MARKYYPGRNFAERDISASLQYQDDPIVHNLFISSIRLINFFAVEFEILEVKGGRDQQLLKSKYEAVCSQLNNNSRETALFRCLEVPNDEVRLEVVKCLFNVPIRELDAEE